MSEKRGIEEIKDLIELLDKAIEVAERVLSDGKISFTDIPALIGLVGPVREAVVGFGDVFAEAKDIDGAEAEELGRLAYALATKLVTVFIK